MSLWEYANPLKFSALATKALPVMWTLTAITLIGGIGWGFFGTGDDYEQGSTVKIIFLHVPTAMMAINAWIMMLIASLIWFIRRHHVSALAARAAAPVGMIFTLVAMVTGAVWGKPMWGTYWAWDPRLTSFMILLLFYFGYMAVWQLIEDDDTAADLTALVCMVGSVFALLSRYAVQFWNQGLHQGTSVPLATGERSIDDSYFVPLMVAMAGAVLLFVTLVLLRTRLHIHRRRTLALIKREGAS